VTVLQNALWVFPPLLELAVDVVVAFAAASDPSVRTGVGAAETSGKDTALGQDIAAKGRSSGFGCVLQMKGGTAAGVAASVSVQKQPVVADVAASIAVAG